MLSCLALNVYQLMTPAEIRQKAKRILRRADIPQQRNLAAYQWRDVIGETSKTVVGKRDRQVLDAIIATSVFCASPVRTSDIGLRLRRNHDVPVLRRDFTKTVCDERVTYGIYRLAAEIRLADPKTEGK